MELGEWLNPDQMQKAKAAQAVEQSIVDAIGRKRKPHHEDVAQRVTKRVMVEQSKAFDAIFLFIAVNGAKVLRLSRSN